MPFSLVRIESSIQGAAHVVAVGGEIDLSSIEKLRRAVDAALESGPELLVLDLSEVEFCDSSGIHLVVTAHQRAIAQGARFVAIRPTGPAWRPFELCHIDREVPFADSHDEPARDGSGAEAQHEPATGRS